jgi:hypothetical protein
MFVRWIHTFRQLASASWPVIFVKDGGKYDQQRDQPDEVDPRATFVGVRQKQQRRAVPGLDKKEHSKRQEERISRLPPKADKENAGDGREGGDYAE